MTTTLTLTLPLPDGITPEQVDAIDAILNRHKSAAVVEAMNYLSALGLNAVAKPKPCATCPD